MVIQKFRYQIPAFTYIYTIVTACSSDSRFNASSREKSNPKNTTENHPEDADGNPATKTISANQTEESPQAETEQKSEQQNNQSVESENKNEPLPIEKEMVDICKGDEKVIRFSNQEQTLGGEYANNGTVRIVCKTSNLVIEKFNSNLVTYNISILDSSEMLIEKFALSHGQSKVTDHGLTFKTDSRLLIDTSAKEAQYTGPDGITLIIDASYTYLNEQKESDEIRIKIYKPYIPQ
ncbi:MAG: hypothetical protein R3B45_12740 [Bdellovibrionota bacterium]